MKSTAIFSALAAIVLAGCASTKAPKRAADQVPERVGADGVVMPSWVMAGEEAEDGIYAVGSAKFSSRANSLKAARTNARAELTQTVQTTLKTAVTTYAEDMGASDSALNYMEQATVERAVGILQGSSQKDQWVDNDGTTYVLMFLPFKAMLPEANNIVDEYVSDKKAQITEQKVAEALKKYRLLESGASE